MKLVASDEIDGASGHEKKGKRRVLMERASC